MIILYTIDNRLFGSFVMPEAFLVAVNLHKSYNGNKAVDGVSFLLEREEIFGLLGPNCAGKTTTIRILSAIIQPEQGDVTIDGHSIKQDAESVRGLIGICPQELALYGEMSAYDNPCSSAG